MKHTIQRRLLALFLASLAISIVVCAAFSFQSSYKMSMQQGRSYGLNTTNTLAGMVNEVGLDRLSDPANAELYASFRKQMRNLCSAANLTYLYVYTVDDTELRHFIITVAADDEKDLVMQREFPIGKIGYSPLLDAERTALRGEQSYEPARFANDYGNEVSWTTPCLDADGSVIALIGVDYDISVGEELVKQRFISSAVPVVLVLVLTFIALFFFTRMRIIVPIRRISSRMERFDPSNAPEPLNITSQDEIQQISEAFDKMSDDIRAHLDSIRKISAEQAKAQAQMDVARRIQCGMVPASFHEHKNGVDVSAFMESAREVGGDFYDCFPLGEDRYCAFIGDVSGKGVTAALFMAMVKSMLRDHLKLGMSPAAALNIVNDELRAANPEGLFATVFAFVLDTGTGELLYANGGHNAPLLLRGDGAVYLEPDPGIALGVFEDAGIADDRLTLAPGEGILLYTDGITEAVNTSRRFYGMQRLQELLSAAAANDSEAVSKAVRESVTAFFAGGEQFDDMTLLALFRRGAAPAEIELPAEFGSLDIIKPIVLREGGGNGKKILLACDEALSNIVRYSGATQLFFSCETGNGYMRVTFRDNGTPFDPFAEESGDFRDFDGLDAGGMGIAFIRELSSEASWRFEDGFNVLSLKFDI
ncbi:MAG: SpoIIE family protein phosphatase [Oscillospiraceae bacterium]|nr:SpoIIE family protein phosphatase [Oscillospiraceae bacterium]